MQFTHSRLLITSSRPLPFFSLYSVLLPFLRSSPFPSVSPPVFRWFRCRFLRFSAGSPPFLRSSTGFPFFRWFLRFPAGFSVSPFFAGSPPFPRYRSRLGAPPEGAVGAVTEGETAEAWEERDAGDVVEGETAEAWEEGDAGGLRRAVPHFAQNMVQLDRGCTDMICFIYICRRLHSISKEMWGKNVM